MITRVWKRHLFSILSSAIKSGGYARPGFGAWLSG